MRLAGRKGNRKRLAGREQMTLPDYFGNLLRAQAVRERRRRVGGSKEIVHGRSTPRRTARGALTPCDGAAYIDGAGPIIRHFRCVHESAVIPVIRGGRELDVIRDNPVKRTLAAGGSAFGAMIFECFSPGIPQICKNAGAEYVLFDMEHTG